ncbi:MAG TPA: terminase family protein [Candidatus Saccharimonadales bacterium]|nr:terminase family protein [Candidatus Saccharimonadales bacterium]
MKTRKYFEVGRDLGIPEDLMLNLYVAGAELQPKQLLASAAARECDLPDGPTDVGFGGARCGGKTHWLLVQIGCDDCQRMPGLKCLLLRKSGKSNIEHFEDLRRKIYKNFPHTIAIRKGELTFANGSRIVIKHYQHEKDLDDFIGIEYDLIAIEEATTLSPRKHSDISTCCRSSKKMPDGMPWRPRIYSTTNPGGTSHGYYKSKFIVPWQSNQETTTRFIQALVADNKYIGKEYIRTLENQTGWKRRAWLDGDWDFCAGQYFSKFSRAAHVIDDFDDSRGVQWFAALDFGFRHHTVVLVGCLDSDGNMFIVDEHAERMWLPEQHARAISEMFNRHQILCATPPEPEERIIGGYAVGFEPVLQGRRYLSRFSAGADVFSRQFDGSTIAMQYRKHGITLTPAATERIHGWAEILTRLGDPDRGIPPRLFIHKRCARLIECLPTLQHDDTRPEDVLKVDVGEDGAGGDDTADALRYLVATKPRILFQTRLLGT